MFVSIDKMMGFEQVSKSFEMFPEISNTVAMTANNDVVCDLLGPNLCHEIEQSNIKVCAMMSGDVTNMGFALHDPITGDVGVLMYLNGMSTYELSSMLKHELVHCKQFQEGRLLIDGSDVYWNGKLHPTYPLPTYAPISTEGKRMYFVDIMKYNSQPWELEANRDVWSEIFGDAWDMDIVTSWARDVSPEDAEAFIISGGKPWLE